MSAKTIKKIDETRLADDVEYRFKFVTGLIGFGAEDVEAIHGAASHLGPLVPTLVDTIYEKLFEYDATMQYFVKPSDGYGGPPPESFDELDLEHEYIQFRREHLCAYLVQLVTRPSTRFPSST